MPNRQKQTELARKVEFVVTTPKLKTIKSDCYDFIVFNTIQLKNDYNFTYHIKVCMLILSFTLLISSHAQHVAFGVQRGVPLARACIRPFWNKKWDTSVPGYAVAPLI